ncbi:M56 family metallopeptidase [Confluentibacter flavum]|uniref:BlaR1 peptidase M56 family protein n=1 Tax=Confluentibacter flavum TaxID=1909700 RepID=A0A2N3HFJ9_9FLAO|nr:M56 family metallopeptidase [Confluentibacter flavum]PKQ43757.1 blaR1 peptidase M56 family protein [Confluentibacter flavum]
MIAYFIQVAAFQLVFLMIYDAFLKKETFFNWNRIYLLATALLSVVIPFIRLEVLKNTLPQQYIINLPEVIIGNAPTNQNAIQLETVVIESRPFWTWENILYVGIIIATLLFVFKIVKVILMLIKNPKSRFGNLLIINLLNSNAAFSFFHYIFLGERLNDNDKNAILKHEMVHVREKHTFDLLFFEAMRILFWFNPLVYMYQNRIMALHEFIADQEAVKHLDKSHYYQNLLSQVFQTQNISFINPFFHQSLIKKRIVMLQKSKSKQVKLFKYALLIPIVFGMLVYTSCAKDEVNKLPQESSLSISEQIETLKATMNAKDGQLTDEEKQSLLKLLENVNFAKDKDSPWKVSVATNVSEGEVVDGQVEVPFAVIENVPTYPGCEKGNNEQKKKCMSEKIQEFVGKKFNTDLASDLGLSGRQRITVMFKIDTEGNIVSVQSRAPHPALEEEATRVIKLLPKMQPGKQRGKPVIVPYSLPIVFVVQGDEPELEKK